MSDDPDPCPRGGAHDWEKYEYTFEGKVKSARRCRKCLQEDDL